MLDSMRGLAKGVIAKGLMLFLVLTFAIWGMGDIVRGSGGNFVAKVGDNTIGPNSFQSEFRNSQQALASMGIKNISDQTLANEVLRRMVQQELIAGWTKELGLQVNEATLATAIARNAEFKGVDGKFDPALFKASLAQRRLTEPVYLRALAQQVGNNALLATIDSSDIQAPASLIDLALTAGAQQRDAVLFTLAVGTPDLSAVTDEDAQAYYDENPEVFTPPEKRSLEYVVLDAVSLKKKLDAAVTDEALDSEQREQAMQDIAMSIEDALAGGSTIGEAVATTGVQAQSRVLKDITAEQFAGSTDELLQRAVSEAFEIEEGETSGLQSTNDGRHFIVAVTGTLPAQPEPLEKVLPQVRNAVAAQYAQDGLRERVAILKKALADKTEWKDAAQDVDAHTRLVTRIGRPNTDAQGKIIAHPAVPTLLQQAIFERNVGETAGPISRDNGELVIALVTAVHDVKPKATDKDREAIAEEYNRLLGDDVSGSLLRSLSQRHKVQINTPMMQQIAGGDE